MKIDSHVTGAPSEIRHSIDVSPYELVGELGPCRVAIYDNRQERYTRFIDVAPKAKLSLDRESLEEHLDYRFKLQKLENDKWCDLTILKRLLPEEITTDGLKYLLYPCKSSAHLIIVFQAMNTNPGYNYIRTLSSIHANKLFIKDDYGTDETTRSSYYLGPNRTFSIAESTQRLIRSTLDQTRIKNENCIFVGSSKGGFAALYHGFTFGTGSIIVAGPQVKLGSFLSSTRNANLPPILRYLAGDASADSVAWANQILPDVIRQARAPYPQVFIHVGSGDHHYEDHVKPFIRDATSLGINTIHLDVKNYVGHAGIAEHFPDYLRDIIDRIA